MKKLKELFLNSRLGLGVLIGIFLGVLIGGGKFDGGIAAAVTISLLAILVENMINNLDKD